VVRDPRPPTDVETLPDRPRVVLRQGVTGAVVALLLTAVTAAPAVAHGYVFRLLAVLALGGFWIGALLVPVAVFLLFVPRWLGYGVGYLCGLIPAAATIGIIRVLS
jgi:hypothetical protein